MCKKKCVLVGWLWSVSICILCFVHHLLFSLTSWLGKTQMLPHTSFKTSWSIPKFTDLHLVSSSQLAAYSQWFADLQGRTLELGALQVGWQTLPEDWVHWLLPAQTDSRDMNHNLFGRKKPKLVHEVEQYWLNIVGLTSTHSREGLDSQATWLSVSVLEFSLENKRVVFIRLQVAESGSVLFHGLAITNTLFEHKGGLKVYLVPDHLRSHSVINRISTAVCFG